MRSAVLESARRLSSYLNKSFTRWTAVTLALGFGSLAATVAATGATLDDSQRTIFAAHTLEIGLFAGHIGLLRHAADISLSDYESENVVLKIN